MCGEPKVLTFVKTGVFWVVGFVGTLIVLVPLVAASFLR